MLFIYFFFFHDPATTEIYTYCHTLSLHDALPISRCAPSIIDSVTRQAAGDQHLVVRGEAQPVALPGRQAQHLLAAGGKESLGAGGLRRADRKSTRLNSSH